MYLICYDITKDKVRNKIFKTLEGYGQHKQFSVFECDITKKQLNTLVKKLNALLKDEKPEDGGNIRIYSICDHCYEKTKILGTLAEKKDSQTIVI